MAVQPSTVAEYQPADASALSPLGGAVPGSVASSHPGLVFPDLRHLPPDLAFSAARPVSGRWKGSSRRTLGLVSPTHLAQGPRPQLGKPRPDRLIHWTEICEPSSGGDPWAAGPV